LSTHLLHDPSFRLSHQYPNVFLFSPIRAICPAHVSQKWLRYIVIRRTTTKN
jgi:hypothetical protein